MYPVYDNTHATEQLALLTDHYRGKPNIQGVLNSIAPEVQLLEDTFYSIITSFLLVNSPVGDQLNAIGSVVGAQRGTLNDADYLREIILQIRVNRSQGLSNDIIDIAVLALGPGAVAPDYLDMPIANFLIECWNLPSPNIVWPLMGAARSVGTRGVLHYTTWADGSDFEFSSRYSTSTGELGWGSRYSSGTGGLMAAGAAF